MVVSWNMTQKIKITTQPILCCPVSKELMEDPVVAGDGFLGLWCESTELDTFKIFRILVFFFYLFLPGARFTYERSYIEGCLKSKKLSPMTGKNIETQVLGSNSRKWFFAARSFCQKFATAKSLSLIFPRNILKGAGGNESFRRCQGCPPWIGTCPGT